MESGTTDRLVRIRAGEINLISGPLSSISHLCYFKSDDKAAF